MLTLYYTPIVEIPPQETPTQQIPNPPIATTNFNAWALVNLILAVVGILAAVVLLIAFFSRRKQEETTDEDVETAEQTCARYDDFA